MAYVATFLDDGEDKHIAVKHRDGSISVVHVSREDDRMRVQIEPARNHRCEVRTPGGDFEAAWFDA